VGSGWVTWDFGSGRGSVLSDFGSALVTLLYLKSLFLLCLMISFVERYDLLGFWVAGLGGYT
jgi:hypothetical protein